MKSKFLAGVLASLLLAASVAFAQTAVVMSVENASNKVQTFSGASTFTLAATPTAAWELAGSATKTVYVKNVTVSCNKTTAGFANVHLIRTSAAATGGTAVAITETKMDSANATNTAVARHFTAEPTPGATAGTVAIQLMAFQAPADVTGNNTPAVFDFGKNIDQYVVLRGTAQTLTVNFAGATLTGAVCSIYAVWMEK